MIQLNQKRNRGLSLNIATKPEQGKERRGGSKPKHLAMSNPTKNNLYSPDAQEKAKDMENVEERDKQHHRHRK